MVVTENAPWPPPSRAVTNDPRPNASAERPTSRRRNLRLVFACLALQLTLGITLSRSQFIFPNTIHNNGNWISTKTQFARAVMGAFSFILKPQALLEGRLNLAAWYGYHEVLYREPLDVEAVEFDFLLSRGSYLCFIFNKSEDDFSGLRLSLNPRVASICFRASVTGEFKKTHPVFIPELRDWTKHHIEAHFSKHGYSLFLDGLKLGDFAESISDRQALGFRGGERKAYVDNVVFRLRNGDAVSESFSSRKDAPRITVICVLVSFLVNILLAAMLAMTTRLQGRHVGFAVLLVNLVLIAASALIFGWQYVKGEYYPLVRNDARRREEYWKRSTTAEIVAHLHKTHGHAPDDNVHRILFIGGSQTGGAGAWNEDDIFVRILERRLNESNSQGTRFECINGGISALGSWHLLALYREEWAQLGAKTVVINMSTNDFGNPSFGMNLEQMLWANGDEGARVVFVLEPNSPEHEDEGLSANHDVMRKVASEHGLAVIDLHSHLLERWRLGFLWWDFCHLTPFGNRLAAQKLYEDLAPLLTK